MCQVLKDEGVKHFNRQTCGEWSQELEARQIKCCQKLVRYFCQLSSIIEVVIADESYFPSKNDGTGANGGFYTQDKENTPPEIRYRTTKNFQRSYRCGLQSVSVDILKCSSVLAEPVKKEKSTERSAFCSGWYLSWPVHLLA